MKWRKSPEELVAAFESVMLGALAVMRKMFGFPADFIQGNMFMGLHEENMILGLLETPARNSWLSETQRYSSRCLAGPMPEYVVVPASIVHDPEKLGQWVNKAPEYATSLKPKIKKKSAKKIK